MPTERPILFKGPLVRALLDGTKTQTRRLCKPARDEDYAKDNGAAASVHADGSGKGWIAWWPNHVSAEETRRRYPGDHGFRCPYGLPGDHLWVRETFARVLDGEPPYSDDGPAHTEYLADSPSAKYPGEWPDDCGDDPDCPRWKPSIHMRREFSRIDLEITEVRVQRLQDITEEESKAEGFAPHLAQEAWSCMTSDGGAFDMFVEPSQEYREKNGLVAVVHRPSHILSTAREVFARTWDAINGKRASWESNPWVWVVSFKRIRP